MVGQQQNDILPPEKPDSNDIAPTSKYLDDTTLPDLNTEHISKAMLPKDAPDAFGTLELVNQTSAPNSRRTKHGAVSNKYLLAQGPEAKNEPNGNARDNSNISEEEKNANNALKNGKPNEAIKFLEGRTTDLINSKNYSHPIIIQARSQLTKRLIKIAEMDNVDKKHIEMAAGMALDLLNVSFTSVGKQADTEMKAQADDLEDKDKDKDKNQPYAFSLPIAEQNLEVASDYAKVYKFLRTHGFKASEAPPSNPVSENNPTDINGILTRSRSMTSMGARSLKNLVQQKNPNELRNISEELRHTVTNLENLAKSNGINPAYISEDMGILKDALRRLEPSKK